MKLIEIPVNTVVELRFYYMGIRYKVNTGLYYKYSESVYISALRAAGKTIPASKLRSVTLVYRYVEGMFTFHNVALRSLSLNGQKLYAVQSSQEAQIIKNSKSVRLHLGIQVIATIIWGDKKESLQCLLKDISATGMAILSNKKLDETAKIEISYKLNNSNEVLVGNIVRINEINNGSGYLYGCEFEEANAVIGRYVLQKLGQKEQEDISDRRFVQSK